jgi:hypothetical protein
LRHYLELYRTINKTFGFRLRPLGTFAILQLRQAIYNFIDLWFPSNRIHIPQITLRKERQLVG